MAMFVYAAAHAAHVLIFKMLVTYLHLVCLLQPIVETFGISGFVSL